MLTLYRRHRESCKSAADRYYRKCRCAVWCEGTVEGKYLRQSLKTRSWERGEELKRQLEDGTKTDQPKSITIKDALDAFVADCEARKLNDRTFKKYKLLATRLQDFAASRGIGDLSQFNHEQARAFRASWKGAALTLSKTLERLRAFFKFCVENDWITKNPAKSIKAPKVKPNPRLPFSEQEVQNILSQAQDDRELAFLLTLRHTGLRIGDASLLKVAQVSDSRVYLYTTKAGTPVSILIPETLSSLLKNIPTRGGYFFLWGESTHVHSVSNLWRRRIKAICKEVGIMPDHPHRMRHSLAADLLMKGASVEDVAAILGNSPAVIIKHYSQWIKGRQDRLDTFMEATFTKPKLVRVK